MLYKRLLIAFMLCAFCIACNKPTQQQTVQPSASPSVGITPSAVLISTSQPTELPTFTPKPVSVLTICLGSEPQSLFLYQAFSQVERSVLQAVYDGPVDILKDGFHPVILAKTPSLADGDIVLTAVEVLPGTLILDAAGQLTSLQEGTSFYPAGCIDNACVQTYTGDQPVSMDQLSISYSILPGITWSDGAPLTADDSLYSYEVAKGVFSPGQFSGLDMTADYQILDELQVVWRGLPGYRNTEPLSNFFSPLPRHLWGKLATDELLVDERVNRMPLGWGPYVIAEWVAGDHITFNKNTAYFRSQDGLPYFDHLVYRFVKDGAEALDALQTKECDVVDPSAALDLEISRLETLQSENRLKIAYQQDAAWEMIAMGIESLNPQRPALFAQPQVRQAIAMCIDRNKIASELMYEQSSVPDTFVPASNLGHSAGLPQYAYDPVAASGLMQSVGWMDADGDVSTPRTALGVPGVPDGTPFQFTYLVSSDAERPVAAQMIQTMLAECGIQANLEFQNPANYLAAGPTGPVFGRDFDMAQFAMPFLIDPPCQFYTSTEIPGPYPTFSRGWGGMNISGYRSVAYDNACHSVRTSNMGTPEYEAALAQTQAIFAQDLPVLPLYTRFRVMATQPDICHLMFERAYNEPLWNLEMLDIDKDCLP